MSLHLIKLAVGVESLDHFRALIKGRTRRRQGRAMIAAHTRQMPRRADEILAGGSLYWVVRGQILCRQAVLELEFVTDSEGRASCLIWRDPALVLVAPRPRRPFQGWRYLPGNDAPPDISGDDMPAGMAAELAALGLV